MASDDFTVGQEERTGGAIRKSGWEMRPQPAEVNCKPAGGPSQEPLSRLPTEQDPFASSPYAAGGNPGTKLSGLASWQIFSIKKVNKNGHVPIIPKLFFVCFVAASLLANLPPFLA